MTARRIDGVGAFSCLVSLAAILSFSSRLALASDGEIGIFFDPNGNSCLGSIPCGQTGTVYLYAFLEGRSEEGITGAEYAVGIGNDGNADPAWTFAEHFTPATVVLGLGAFSPPDTRDFSSRRYRGRGVNVAFSECQHADGGRILLETVDITNLGCATDPLLLVVLSHDTPSNQYFQCPLFTLCDEPDFTKVCLGKMVVTCGNPEPPYPTNAACSTSGHAVINPGSEDYLVPCRPTAVEPTTWSSVKSLFR